MARSITPELPAVGVSNSVSTSRKVPACGRASQLPGCATAEISIEKLLSAWRSTVQELSAAGSPVFTAAGLPPLSAVKSVQSRAGGVCPLMR